MKNNTDEIQFSNFEKMLSLSDLIFTQGYQCTGKLDVEIIENSYLEIIRQVERFNFDLVYQQDGTAQISKSDKTNSFFSVVESDEPEEALKQISANSHELLRSDTHKAPIGLIIIRDTCKPRFILTLMADHLYVDGQSANHILRLILKHYDASIQNSATNEVVQSAVNLSAPDVETLINTITEEISDFDHESNLNRISNYDFATEQVTVPTEIDHESSAGNLPAPYFTRIDLSNLITHCRDKSENQKLSKNSIASALITKCVQQLASQEGEPLGQCTFAMAASILNEEEREMFCGNYVVNFPVTVNFSADRIYEIAESIQNRVHEFRSTRQDISLFQITENTELKYNPDNNTPPCDPHAFYITNWTNHHFLSESNFLNSFSPELHYGLMTPNPDIPVPDSYEAQQVFIICFSPGNVLSVCIYPSVKKTEPLNQILSLFPSVIENEISSR